MNDAAYELLEACAMISQFSDQLAEKVDAAIQTKSGDFVAAYTSVFSDQIQNYAHELTRILSIAAPASVEEKIRIAGLVAGILSLMSSVENGVGHSVKIKQDSQRTLRARTATAFRLFARDAALREMADELIKTKATHWTPNWLESQIRIQLSSISERTPQQEDLANLKDGAIRKNLVRLGYSRKAVQSSGKKSES